MNIIALAKQSENRIRNREDLMESQMEMLKTLLQHNAISEAEYRKGIDALSARAQ